MSVLVSRVLDPQPVESWTDYLAVGGGRGLVAAAKLGPDATIDEVEAAGLRGRGGAGFPTGHKWRTVRANRAHGMTVVVNGAEGEPGSFKDRELLARNPFRVLEGALIAAEAVAAGRIVVAVKESFTEQIERLHQAIAEITSAGAADGVRIELLPGPPEYLFGEETALLEVAEGRPPFPRVAPPYREGVHAEPSTLANNVETLANVPAILADGPARFRELGTDASPGTVVCTVSGSSQRAGVGEVPMGTPLRDVITELGGGPVPGAHITAVLSGVSHPFLPASSLGTALTYEDMEAAGSGLGTAGFIVFDDSDDLVAVAQGVARFLAVESCGQCTPCKQDGLAIAELLDNFCRSAASDHDVDELAARILTVTDEARCFLAHQQFRVVNSLLALFPEALAKHLEAAEERADPVTPVLIAPLTVVRGEAAEIDEDQATKQPDWSHDEIDSGAAPAERLSTRP